MMQNEEGKGPYEIGCPMHLTTVKRTKSFAPDTTISTTDHDLKSKTLKIFAHDTISDNTI